MDGGEEEREGNDRGKDGPTGPELKYQYHPVTPWTTQGSTGALVRGVLDTPLRVLGTTSPQQAAPRALFNRVDKDCNAPRALGEIGIIARRGEGVPLDNPLRNSAKERKRASPLHTSDFFLDYYPYLFRIGRISSKVSNVRDEVKGRSQSFVLSFLL